MKCTKMYRGNVQELVRLRGPKHEFFLNYPGEGPTTDWVSHPLKGWSRCKVVCCEGVRVPSNAAWSLGV